MNELPAGIGDRISSACKSKKMTQEALAELADVSYQTISSAELGKKALRPENIIKISQAMQVSTDYLLTGNRNTMKQCRRAGEYLSGHSLPVSFS